MIAVFQMNNFTSYIFTVSHWTFIWVSTLIPLVGGMTEMFKDTVSNTVSITCKILITATKYCDKLVSAVDVNKVLCIPVVIQVISSLGVHCERGIINLRSVFSGEV